MYITGSVIDDRLHFMCKLTLGKGLVDKDPIMRKSKRGGIKRTFIFKNVLIGSQMVTRSMRKSLFTLNDCESEREIFFCFASLM